MKKTVLKIIGILLLIFLVVGIFLFFYFFSAKKRSSSSIFPLFNKNKPSASSSLPNASSSKKPVVIKKIKNFFPTTKEGSPEKNNLPLRNFSLFFAEQLGSYSAEGNYANLKNLLPYLTGDAKKWAEGIIQSPTPETKKYYGVTTKVLRVQTKKQGDSWQAEVLCQRIITQGEARKMSIKYQKLFLTIKRSGKKWQVSAIQWGKPFAE